MERVNHELMRAFINAYAPGQAETTVQATLSDHPLDFVIVHSLFRFSHDRFHSELYVKQLRKSDVELVSITQDVGQDANGELVRKMLNVMDEHSNRENAKHVHRAMLENARQGFWNGSRPPLGYRVEITERRGNRDKKVLVVGRGGGEHYPSHLRSRHRRQKAALASRPSPPISTDAASRAGDAHTRPWAAGHPTKSMLRYK